jgi:sugar lactone lactonase YvrE
MHEAVALSSITPIGFDLHRPECVLPAPNGDVYVSDWRGGVAVVRADGSQHVWLAKSPGFDFKPNGIAFAPSGGFLIANLGDDGGIWRLALDGALTPILTELDGAPAPPANFIQVDQFDRMWVSVSTRKFPRQQAWRNDVKDGFIALIDHRGARIVADGLHYANEVRVDPSGRWLYVVETFGRRLVRYPIAENGDLKAQESVVAFERDIFPDGLAFDVDGGVWTTSLISNCVVRATPDSAVQVVIAEVPHHALAEAEAAFAEGRMEARHLGAIAGTRFQHLTSIGFGGPDLRTGWLGSLHADCLYRFSSPVAGVPPPYWNKPLP